MMKKPNHGGYAFPTGLPLEGGNTGGMTLRDYFAAAALQGMLANPNASYIADETAVDAYEFADAMLVQRWQKETE